MKGKIFETLKEATMRTVNPNHLYKSLCSLLISHSHYVEITLLDVGAKLKFFFFPYNLKDRQEFRLQQYFHCESASDSLNHMATSIELHYSGCTVYLQSYFKSCVPIITH